MATRRVRRTVCVPIDDAQFIQHLNMVRLGILSPDLPVEILVEGRVGAEEGWHKANVMDAEVNQMVGGYRG
jgi:hypothetical protein